MPKYLKAGRIGVPGESEEKKKDPAAALAPAAGSSQHSGVSAASIAAGIQQLLRPKFARRGASEGGADGAGAAPAKTKGKQRDPAAVSGKSVGRFTVSCGSPNGRFLAAGTDIGRLVVWDLSTSPPMLIRKSPPAGGHMD